MTAQRAAMGVEEGGTGAPAANVTNVISVDAMGGDKGPAIIVAGIAKFLRKSPDARILLHGPEDILKPLVDKRKIGRNVEISHASDVVTMTDKPAQVMRRGGGTSMWSAITALREGKASVCFSCGNTGALMAVSMVRLRKAPGVNRPAIACLWPSRNHTGFNVMLDCGADIRADADDLLAFALMGVSYARNALDLSTPRVGILNVGVEENKGRPELKDAHDKVAEAASRGEFTFVGYIEGGDIPSAKLDVIVTDGFSGNIALKTAEGTASFVSDRLRESFKHTPMSRLAALMALPSLKRLKKSIDPRRVNGGVFLGLNGTVVKSHGSADATGVAAALKLAYDLAQTGFTERLVARVAQGRINDDANK